MDSGCDPSSRGHNNGRHAGILGPSVERRRSDLRRQRFSFGNFRRPRCQKNAGRRAGLGPAATYGINTGSMGELASPTPIGRVLRDGRAILDVVTERALSAVGGRLG